MFINSGVFSAFGVSTVLLSMALLRLSLSAAIYAHLFLVCMSSSLCFSAFSRGDLLIVFLDSSYSFLISTVLNMCSLLFIWIDVVSSLFFCRGNKIIDSTMNASFHITMFLCRCSIVGLSVVTCGDNIKACNILW